MALWRGAGGASVLAGDSLKLMKTHEMQQHLRCWPAIMLGAYEDEAGEEVRG